MDRRSYYGSSPFFPRFSREEYERHRYICEMRDWEFAQRFYPKEYVRQRIIRDMRNWELRRRREEIEEHLIRERSPVRSRDLDRVEASYPTLSRLLHYNHQEDRVGGLRESSWDEDPAGEMDYMGELNDDYSEYDSISYDPDWVCECNASNHSYRETCYRCGCFKENSFGVSVVPTNTLMFRGLDTLTTESNILEYIQNVSNLPVKSVQIKKDPITNISSGTCYIDMKSEIFATSLRNSLLVTGNAPVLDGKIPIVTYYDSEAAIQSANALAPAPKPAPKARKVAVKADQEKKTTSEVKQYTLKDVTRLSEYSANLYAKTPEEKETYLAYYHQYYHKLISEGGQISLPSDLLSSKAANPTVITKKGLRAPLTEAPDGSGSKTYCIPDVSTYQYNKDSGYYYDPYTTLYYDANSQYYYNTKTSKFLYWDSQKCTYLPAPTSLTTEYIGLATTAAKETVEKEEEKKSKDKSNDKVMMSKRITKNMEKWAKTLNSQKERTRKNLVTTTTLSCKDQGASLTGLESKEVSVPSVAETSSNVENLVKTLNYEKKIAKRNLVSTASVNTANLEARGAADISLFAFERKDSVPSGIGVTKYSPPYVPQPDSPLAVYGASDSRAEAEETVEGEEKQHVDWSRLACLLCKRQFPIKEILLKHRQFSDLHKQNLSNWYKSRGLDPNDAQKRTLQYRDRAKERREASSYGEPNKPQQNKLKESYMKSKEATVSYEEPTKSGIGTDNRGNKLLQKMGWQEGMGLGKKNQGRTTVIEAKRRSATAGLGTKGIGSFVLGPGETYKDCVRKLMRNRYEDIDASNS